MSLTISGTTAFADVTELPLVGQTKTLSKPDSPSGPPAASSLVTIDPSVILTDPSRGTLTSVTVQIRGNYQFREDMLAFTPSAATGNIMAIFTLETGTLRLASFGNRATLAQWRAALDTVTYSNTATTPNTAARTITTSATGGIGSSVGTITVVPATHGHSVSLAGTPLPCSASGVPAR